MKFFTREWCKGGLSDEEYEARIVDYKNQLEKIAPKLPYQLGDLVRRHSLHDGVVRQTRFGKDGNSLSVKLVAGNLQAGYEELVLSYERLVGVAGDPTLTQASKAKREIIEDEVDLLPDCVFEHRLLFDDMSVLVVQFKEFSFTSAAMPGRHDSLGR